MESLKHMTENKYKLQAEDIHSMDLNNDTLAKLKQILPEVFSEGVDGKPSIDIERLKIALGGTVDVEADDKTRFSFNWSGKKQAQALANQPSSATLRPSIEDSKMWDSTQNVYIEGDNLEVLKLLQKSYYGQIKMIYIDPPYNTGKDFVYKDNFHDNVKNYLQLTGQVDGEGNKISTNTDKSGRYHTDWLNMMYPRLKLARNLLKDDGVIFISIDDNEVHNLRKICDEIFGEDNFIADIIWERAYSPVNLKKHFSENHDFIIAYARNIGSLVCNGLIRSEESNSRYSNPDKDLRGVWKSSDLSVGPAIQDNIYEIATPSGRIVTPPNGYSWRLNKTRFAEFMSDNRIWFGPNGDATPSIKRFLSEVKNTITPMTIWNYKDVGHSQDAKQKLKELFEDKSYFDYPKPVLLINKILELYSDRDDIVLDFFSGSATTAHAVMQLNADDGGNRKYICVQLPEATAPESEAYKAGYKNICEIGKERIRRAGEKVFAEWTEKQQKTANENDLLSTDTNNEPVTAPDIGFKVFKLDSSNIKPFDANDMFADELLIDGRSSLDLFYEIVLKQGFSLDSRQCVLDIGGTKCYALVHEDNTPFVLAVLDDKVKANFALELLKYTLTLLIVKDECFGTDEIKLNLLATLEQLQNKDNPLQIRTV
jgi:adenine-specific DNA-methyltransferase